jgi:hypothetical protein
MSYLGEVLQDAPALYLRLGDASGTLAADASGNGRHGAYAGSPGLGAAGALDTDPDGAVLFDGANGVITLPALPSLGTTLSVEFWFKPQSGGDATQCIFGEADGSPSALFKNTGRLSVFYSSADHLNTTPLAYDVWHHVCIAVSAGAGTFYVNGVADGTFASFPSGFAPDRIGDDNGSNTYKGWLDEVAMYLSALSSGRVAAHYAAAWRGLISLRPRLRRMLHDEDAANYRWTDQELERHILRALDALSDVWPDERKDALATTPGSRDVSIATLRELVRLEAVEWPVGQFPPALVRFQTWGNTLTLLTPAAPAGAESLNVYWGRRHQIELLTSSLPSEVEETLLVGAAGYAADAWASFAANRANVAGTEAVSQYQSLASRWLTEFRQQLRRFGRASRLKTSTLYTPAVPVSGNTVQWPA